MEQFDLIKKNNYYYFKNNKQNIIIDLSSFVNCFSDSYRALRIDSKLIEKSELSMENFSKQIEELSNLNLNNNLNSMFSNVLDMLKSNNLNIFNNSMISGMLKNFKNQNLFSIQNKINTNIDLLFGLEGIKDYIILIDYKNMKILFFREKEEVGNLIGRSFKILDTNKSFYNVLDNAIFYKDKKLTIKLDSESKEYISCTSDLFKYLKNDLDETQFIELENGKKAYKFKFKISNDEIDFFVSKSDKNLSIMPELPVPEIPNMPNIIPNVNIDLSIPINLFSDAILIDGINNKFAFLKKDYVS